MSEKVGIDQNAEIKIEKGKSVETGGQSWQSIKMLKLSVKMSNQSKCWNCVILWWFLVGYVDIAFLVLIFTSTSTSTVWLEPHTSPSLIELYNGRNDTN